ncbi:MAG: L-histidine N(alpha)-methyltransferase [Gemmatimonadota bacterium]
MHESAVVPATLLSAAAGQSRMRADVRDGLFRGGQKELPPTYFYDARGSILFDEITRLDEYYPTRAERALLEAFAQEIIVTSGARALAELGAGTAEKSRILLRALADAAPGAQYLPIDVDGDTLAITAAELRAEFPSLQILPIVADMRDDVAAAGARHPLLYAFLGSTIGNFGPDAARELLMRIRSSLRPTDRLLLGVDLVKNVATLNAAYNDARGVTADFNLNVLRVLNRELGADFDLDAFTHHAFYNEGLARIEMHLVARTPVTVAIPELGTVQFAGGESVRTEISCKYDRASATALLEGSGFRLTEWMVGEHPQFALLLAEPAP